MPSLDATLDPELLESVKRFCRTKEAALNLVAYLTKIYIAENYIPKSQLKTLLLQERSNQIKQDYTLWSEHGFFGEVETAFKRNIAELEQQIK
jgi:hypothetical protein